MSKSKFTILTPNPNYTGYRDGVLFGNGKAGVDDEVTARNFVRVRGYRCPELEQSKGNEKGDAGSLPENHPSRELLIANGFDTPEKVSVATEAELRAINGIGAVAYRDIVEYYK